jgi:hypothetical protein
MRTIIACWREYAIEYDNHSQIAIANANDLQKLGFLRQVWEGHVILTGRQGKARQGKARDGSGRGAGVLASRRGQCAGFACLSAGSGGMVLLESAE